MAGLGPGEEFDADKAMEGELFKLGMQLEEVHEKVDCNKRSQGTPRLPFQNFSLPASARGTPVMHNMRSASGPDLNTSVDTMIQNVPKRTDQADVSIGYHGNPMATVARTGTPLDGKVMQLQQEYGALMGEYERLKRLPASAERDGQVQQLVNVSIINPFTLKSSS